MTSRLALEGGREMKKKLAFVVMVLACISLALPAMSDASDRRGGRPGYSSGHHGQHYYRGYRPHSWNRYHGGYRYSYGPRIWVGGFYPAPSYYYAPPPVYVVPPPVYAAPAPAPAYAYPDPAATGPQYGAAPSTGSGGEWVTVPGQWVEGKWVEEHRVQVQ
jgi:hypothetical protein